jgi:mycothiol synthase
LNKEREYQSVSQAGWRIRTFRQDDIPAVTALFDAADRADNLFKLSSEESIRETFPQPDADSQSHIIVVEGDAQGGKDGVLGIGKVSPQFHDLTKERVYNVLLRVHPSARPHGVQHVIARHLIESVLATEDAPTMQPAEKSRVLTYVFDSQLSAIEAWESVGLRRVRTGWTMKRALDGPIEAAPVPREVVLRTHRYPGDNAAALQALNNSFVDYYDFHPVSDASWERHMAAPYARPDLSWLALSSEDAERAVGMAGCLVNVSENRETGRQEGWIEGIGVVPAFRRKGVGKALLTRCLLALQSAGIEAALADVDSESTAATRLFESAGFSVRNALLQYECPLGSVQL